MAGNQDVEALEALASTLTDSVNGYEDAAESASDPGIKSFLQQKAQMRRGLTEEFRQRISGLGGNADIGGSASAAAHRAFVGLRSMFQDDTKAAVAEVERGEEYLKERFDKYLGDGSLSPDTRSFISQAYSRAQFDNATWDGLVQSYR
jgi:uncharacterized protein (TIGR02284 family)